MSRVIIENKSSLSDVTALDRVQVVMMHGRISNDNKQYCYYTTFSDCAVATDLNKASDKFTVIDKSKG